MYDDDFVVLRISRLTNDFNISCFTIIEERKDRIDTIENIVRALDFDSNSFTSVVGKLDLESATFL